MSEEKMEIHQKVHNARKFIKTLSVEKGGYNEHSKYKYYTPEQVEEMVFKSCEDQKIMPVFSLERNKMGVFGILTIHDLVSGGSIVTKMATEIPKMTATNAAQQCGGMHTYTERYMLQSLFGIKENPIDPDSHDNRNLTNPPKEADLDPDGNPKKWLNKMDLKGILKPEWQQVIDRAKRKGMPAEEIKDYYLISKPNFELLKNELK